MKRLSGQSFVEYMILVAFIVAGILVVAEGPLHDAITAFFSKTTDGVGVIANYVD